MGSHLSIAANSPWSRKHHHLGLYFRNPSFTAIFLLHTTATSIWPSNKLTIVLQPAGPAHSIPPTTIILHISYCTILQQSIGALPVHYNFQSLYVWGRSIETIPAWNLQSIARTTSHLCHPLVGIPPQKS